MDPPVRGHDLHPQRNRWVSEPTEELTVEIARQQGDRAGSMPQAGGGRVGRSAAGVPDSDAFPSAEALPVAGWSADNIVPAA
jgi:hypothetical protein